MAPPRRLSNGRSPLVNQQSQITKFFNKTTTSSSAPPNNNNEPIPNPSPSPSPNPTTPSSHQFVPKKVSKSITLTTKKKEPETASYGAEVLDKGIRVYWPLDQSWYKGHVKGFDELSGKHKVLYEDGDGEELYLCKEKIEWVEEKVKSFKRLRKAVVDEGEGLVEVEDEEKKDESSVDGDDSSDEDWGKNVGREVFENELDDMVLDDDDGGSDLESRTPDIGSKKRKVGENEISGFSRKNMRVEKAIPSSYVGGNIMEQNDKGDSD